jgi:hypothetical protein
MLELQQGNAAAPQVLLSASYALALAASAPLLLLAASLTAAQISTAFGVAPTS